MIYNRMKCLYNNLGYVMMLEVVAVGGVSEGETKKICFLYKTV